MPKWKGKNVSKAHYENLRRSVEFKLVKDRANWGFYKDKPYRIGGKKNGNDIRKGMCSYL